MIYILLKYFKYIYIKKNVQIHKNVYKLLVSIAFSSSLYYTNVIDVSPSYFTKHIQHGTRDLIYQAFSPLSMIRLRVTEQFKP